MKKLNDVISLKDLIHTGCRSRPYGYVGRKNHSDGPLEVDVDLLKQLIEQDPQLTSRCLAEQLGCSYVAVEKTSERIRQDLEIWSLDTPRVITTSTATPG